MLPGSIWPSTLDSRHSTLPCNPQDAIDLGREALVMATLIAAPVLVAGMVVGLIVGLLQALTQIQEQTVAFVPKLLAMVHRPRHLVAVGADTACRVLARLDREHSEFAVTVAAHAERHFFAARDDCPPPLGGTSLCPRSKHFSSAGSWSSRWCSRAPAALVVTAPIFGTTSPAAASASAAGGDNVAARHAVSS